jgi:hypothetical protein
MGNPCRSRTSAASPSKSPTDWRSSTCSARSHTPTTNTGWTTFALCSLSHPALGLRLHDGTTVSQGVDTVLELLAVRKGEFKAQNNQRRHALNSFWFDNQRAEEATGRCYVQVFAIRDGGPRPT